MSPDIDANGGTASEPTQPPTASLAPLSKRTIAGMISGALLLIAGAFAVMAPLPYVVYQPGLTLDVLAKSGAEPIVQIEGAKSYADTGQLRMVTVSVTSPDTTMRLPELLGAWFDKRSAVVPWDSVYTKGESNKDSRNEGAAQMASSQDVATAIAMREAGLKVNEVTTIAGTAKDSPADGVLRAGDIVESINGQSASDADKMVKLIRATKPGESLTIKVRRQGKELTLTVTPRMIDGAQRIGAQVGADYDFPFTVKLDIDPSIGGPSAGLIFSLAIYDVLTPGSLTDGNVIAGTGEIETDGSVGPIGGIQQKIAGATRDGAKLFLVPADNCDEAVKAVDAIDGKIRLVKVTTMHDARESIQSWAANHNATLPTCKAAS